MGLRVGASHGKSASYLVRVHRSFASGDKIDLVCDVTSQYHLIEGSCEFLSGTSSQYVTTLTSLVTIDIAKVEICF